MPSITRRCLRLGPRFDPGPHVVHERSVLSDTDVSAFTDTDLPLAIRPIGQFRRPRRSVIRVDGDMERDVFREHRIAHEHAYASQGMLELAVQTVIAADRNVAHRSALQFRSRRQTLRGGIGICAHQAIRAKKNAAKVSCDNNKHIIHALSPDHLKNRPAGSARRFAVVRETFNRNANANAIREQWWLAPA